LSSEEIFEREEERYYPVMTRRGLRYRVHNLITGKIVRWVHGYQIVEYVKYYFYRSKRPSRNRNIETRIKKWLLLSEDPEDHWDQANEDIENRLLELGFYPAEFEHEKEGFERVGADLIYQEPKITVIDKDRRYVWGPEYVVTYEEEEFELIPMR
jgi:hypothetical protein